LIRTAASAATERKRRHRRVSRRNAGIAGEAGDPHHPVVLLEERDQRVVIDRPVLRHAIEAAHPEIGRMRRLRIFGQRDKLRLSGPKRGRDKWA